MRGIQSDQIRQMHLFGALCFMSIHEVLNPMYNPEMRVSGEVVLQPRAIQPSRTHGKKYFENIKRGLCSNSV